MRHLLVLELAGECSELDAVQTVTYDLGATFDEGDRLREGNVGPRFAVEVATFGDFTVAARVRFTDERGDDERGDDERGDLRLLHTTSLPLLHATPTGTGPADRSSSVWARRMRSASARAAMGAQAALTASILLLGVLLVVAWPDGSNVIAFLRWRTFISPEARLLLLASAAGGLGALLQTVLTLALYFGNRHAYPSWIGWYLLRAPTGMLLGIVAYLILHAAILAPQTSPAVLSPLGVAGLAFATGLLSARATTKLSEAFRVLVERVDRNEDALPARESSNMDATDAVTLAAKLEQQRIDDVAHAEKVLRGHDLSSEEVYRLADRLKRANEFGLARRLYHRIRERADWKNLTKTAVKVGQQQALVTYKDPDLRAADRFARALEILDEVDQFDFSAPPGRVSHEDPEKAAFRAIEQRQESLGLRGAVYKRRWQIEGQHGDLERAAAYYLKAYELGLDFKGNGLGVETDQGYTGINAAFMLDLLALEDAKQATSAGVKSDAAFQRYRKAREIRQLLAERLPDLARRETYAWLLKMWWFQATLAEVYFGLGEFDKAVEALRGFNAANELDHSGPPLDKISRWEFESTFTQLTTLTMVQRALGMALEPDLTPGGSEPTSNAGQPTNPGASALRGYLGDLAPALDRAETGKLGLALSGGGFRASFFHVGVLAYLAERDVLRRVEVLSCVSGGSILGAHFYLQVKRLLQKKADTCITRADYLAIVEELTKDFLAAVQTNIRSQVYGSIWANIRAFFQPGYTTTRRLGALYEREIYARVKDGDEGKPRHLRDLCVQPKGEPGTFKPKYDNWRRQAKVPILVLNATTLNTGHNWQFTASWMGEPPIGLDGEIEGNYLLRRMYHWEAPRLRSRWRHWYSRWLAPPDYQWIRLGEAVAASSGVPGLFEPLVLPDLFEKKIVRLVDGGVHDNQGIASLLEQDCNVMIVSDASGQMDTQDDPKASRLGVSLRSFSVSMTRVRQAQFRELAARRRSGLLKGLMFLHLKRDLEADPVDWRECQDPHDASDDARPEAQRGVLTQYGMQKSVQRLLSGIRTDLDSFTDLEAFSLMTSGYRQAEAQFACLPGLSSEERVPGSWAFLDIERDLNPGPTFEEATRQLKVGSKTAFKVWHLSRLLQAVALALALAALYGLFRLWRLNQDASLLTVGGLGRLALALGAAAVAPRLVALLRYRKTIETVGLKSLVAAVLALFFKVHMLVFDPVFLKLGNAARLKKRRS